jgi:hypothetical protein
VIAMPISLLDCVLVACMTLLVVVGGLCALHLVQHTAPPPEARAFGQAWGAVFLVALCAGLARAAVYVRTGR